MQQKEILKITVSDYCLVALLCFVSDDSMFFGTSNASYILPVRAFFYTLCTFILLKKNKLKINKGAFIAFSAILFFVLSTILVNGYFTNGYIFFLMTLFLGLSVVSYFSFDRFALLFTKVMVGLSSISLFLLVAYILIPTIVTYFPKIVNLSNNEYYNVFLSVFPVNTGSDIRNYSIFREPGVYSIYLCIALLFTLFLDSVQPYVNKLQFSSILIISIISTLSTAGFVSLIIILFLYAIKTKKIGFLFITTCIILVMILLLQDSIFDKIDIDSNSYRSTLSRISSFIIPSYIIIEGPVFGVGLDNFTTLYEKIGYSIFKENISASNSSTNTIMNTMAIFGIPLGLMFIVSIIKFAKLVSHKMFEILGIILILAVIVSTQELRMSIMLSIIIMYSYKSIKE